MQAALAQELRNIGKNEDALAAITKACELAPDQVRYHTVRAEILVQSGKLEEALKVRRESIDRITNAPQQAEAIGTLVSMYASAGKLGELRSQEDARVRARPGDAASLLILARAADADRDFPAVRSALRTLLAADPGNETALQLMAKLQDATGDIDAAAATYAQLVQRYPARARQFYTAVSRARPLRFSPPCGWGWNGSAARVRSASHGYTWRLPRRTISG